MKKYKFFRYLQAKFSNSSYKVAITPIIAGVISLLCLNVGHAQLTTSTPCSCQTWTTIGSTNGTTSATNISFNSNTCYLIKGRLVVNTSIETQWVNLRFKMEENSQIYALSGVSIDNCYISGCGDMWQGITMGTGIDLAVYGSVLEDANVAIQLGNQSGFVCKYNNFINNYIGIAVGSPHEDVFDKEIHRAEIWGCKFFTNTVVPDPYLGHYYYPSWPTTPSQIPYNQGYAAIFLSGMAQLNIGFVGAEGNDRNSIYQMRNGIILRNSVSDISGTDFYDFEGNIPRSVSNPILDLNQNAINMYRSVTKIQDNTFDNLMVGIYGLESFNTILFNEITLSTPSPGFGFTRGISLLRPQTATIKNNVITEGMRGIAIEEVSNNFLIKGNNFFKNYNYTGINMGIFIRNAKLDPAVGVIQGNNFEIDGAYVSNAIHLVNVNRLLVTGNNIDLLNGNEHQSTGILAVGTYNSLIEKNTLIGEEGENIATNNDGLEFDMSAFNTAFCNSMDYFWNDLHIFGPNIQTKVTSNTMNEAENGLFLEGPAMIGIQHHLGNKWPTSYISYGALSGSLEEVSFSKFNVDPWENSDFLPSPISPTEGWFYSLNNPIPTFTCLTNEPYPFADPDTLAKLIRSDLAFTQFNDQMSWIVKGDIFDQMLFDPTLSSNAVLDSFFNVEDTNPLGKLILWQNHLSSRFGVQRIDKDFSQDTMYYLSEDVVYLDSLIALNPVNIATLLALRELKVDSLLNEYDEWKILLDDEEADSQDNYLEILDDLDILTTTNDLEEYLRLALLLKAQYLTNTSFTSTDSSDLVDLGELCPWEGGRAIAVAHEMYSTIDNKMLLMTSGNCPSPSPFSENFSDASSIAGDIFSVYPNPVYDKVELKTNAEMVEVILSDINMHPILVFNPMRRKFAFNLNDLPHGIFLITVTTKGGVYSKQIVHINNN